MMTNATEFSEIACDFTIAPDLRYAARVCLEGLYNLQRAHPLITIRYPETGIIETFKWGECPQRRYLLALWWLCKYLLGVYLKDWLWDHGISRRPLFARMLKRFGLTWEFIAK
jgi:hypothetical protein